MATYWAYVNNNYKWYAWLYVEDKVNIKIGPYHTKKEAKEAVEDYENSNK